MTGTYLTNITPDSFSGLIFGFEGMKNTVVALNGPTGCKFYHSSVSDDQGLRQKEFDPLNYPLLWYFGQPRVPCTYLDKRDYIYGSRGKLEEMLEFLKKDLPADLLVVVNSPGAALIGDNLRQIVGDVMGDRPAVIVESPGYSSTVWEGYAQASERLVESFAQPPQKKKKSVNLLGLSIFHRNYRGDLLELTRLLKLCGISVNCSLCCQSSLAEVRRLPEAELNVVLYPEYGLSAARLLEEKFGMPYVVGLPIGFTETENLLREICSRLHCDPAPALLEAERARATAYLHISRVNSLTGLPKGVKFAVHGTCSQCLGYARYLIRYLGMTAECISVLDDVDETNPEYRELLALLREFSMESALDRDVLQTESEMVFADANILAKLKLRRLKFSGVEIGLPSFGYVDVIPKAHMGISGALLILEQILNGLLF